MDSSTIEAKGGEPSSPMASCLSALAMAKLDMRVEDKWKRQKLAAIT